MPLPPLVEDFVHLVKYFVGKAPNIRPYRDPLAKKLTYQLGKAIEKENWEQANTIAQNIPPDLIGGVASRVSKDERTSTKYSKWVNHSPKNWIPRVILAHCYLNIGMRARGTGWANTVSDEAWAILARRCEQAHKELLMAYNLDKTQIVPIIEMITVGTVSDKTAEDLWKIFYAGIRLDAKNYDLHSTMVYALSEKWKGEEGDDIQFALNSIKNAELGSPFHSLPAAAHIENWLILDDVGNAKSNYFNQASVKNQLTSSLAKLVARPIKSFDQIYAINRFAFCFYVMGDFAMVRNIMSKIGYRFTQGPWYYISGSDYFLDELAAELIGNKLGRN